MTTTTTAADVAIGAEVIIHSGYAESFCDLYITIVDKGEGDDSETGEHWTVLVVRDRTGREGTLVLADDTNCYIYGK